MRDREFNIIRTAFDQYVEGFRSADPDIQRNYDLKRTHSLYVSDEAAALAESLGLDADQIRWARIMGLLHDVGRFEQYRRHRTFVDSRSEDHAALSVRVLQTEPILNGQPEPWVNRILKAISYHNRYQLPVRETPDVILYTRLLRDADKLDIFRVFAEYYHRKAGSRNPTIELDLPDTPDVSPGVLSDLQQQRSVDKHHVRTLNDFKLLQMGWVFDVNFSYTCRQILQRRILDQLQTALPKTPVFRDTFEAIGRFVAVRAAESDPPHHPE